MTTENDSFKLTVTVLDENNELICSPEALEAFLNNWTKNTPIGRDAEQTRLSETRQRMNRLGLTCINNGDMK